MKDKEVDENNKKNEKQENSDDYLDIGNLNINQEVI